MSKSVSETIVDALSNGARALLPTDTGPRPLSEMPETPNLVLPSGKVSTANADFSRVRSRD
jgi:hypothetical protein